MLLTALRRAIGRSGRRTCCGWPNCTSSEWCSRCLTRPANARMRSAAALVWIRAGRSSRGCYRRFGWSRLPITGEQDRPSGHNHWFWTASSKRPTARVSLWSVHLLRPLSSSILVGEHQGHDPAGHARVRLVGRVAAPVQVVGVDLEQDDLALHPDEAEIVLAIGVVVGGESVEAGDRVINEQEQVEPKGQHARGEHDLPTEAV